MACPLFVDHFVSQMNKAFDVLFLYILHPWNPNHCQVTRELPVQLLREGRYPKCWNAEEDKINVKEIILES